MIFSGCSSTIDQYAGKSPELKLEKFFNGKLKAWGAVMNRSGDVTRRFTADLVGEWNGPQGTLKEDFIYDNGEKQHRMWNLRLSADNGKIIGTAADVVGEGIGRTSGFAMNWKYTLQIKVDGSTYNIPFDDSMYLIDEKSVINKARMTKFGFHVGDVLLFIQKI